MNENEMDIGRCPKCGGALEIPQRLAEFCCMYCGEKLRHGMLLTDAPAGMPDAGGMDYVLEHIGGCLVGRAPLLGSFNRGEYPSAFQSYVLECRPVFEVLSAAADGAEAAAHTEATARVLLDAFVAELEGDARWKRRSGQREQLEGARMLLVAYFAPMVRYLALPVGEGFNTAFRAMWVARYPNYSYELGRFEDIYAGFRTFRDIFRLSRR